MTATAKHEANCLQYNGPQIIKDLWLAAAVAGNINIEQTVLGTVCC